MSVGVRKIKLTALLTVITIALILRQIRTVVAAIINAKEERFVRIRYVPAPLGRLNAPAVVLISRKIIGTAVCAERYVHPDRPAPTVSVAAPLGRLRALAVVLIIRQILGIAVAAEMHVDPVRGGIALKVNVSAHLRVGRLYSMAIVSIPQ
jgi:hypothetical protein